MKIEKDIDKNKERAVIFYEDRGSKMRRGISRRRELISHYGTRTNIEEIGNFKKGLLDGPGKRTICYEEGNKKQEEMESLKDNGRNRLNRKIKVIFYGVFFRIFFFLLRNLPF